MSEITEVDVDGRKGRMGVLDPETNLCEIVLEDGTRIAFFNNDDESTRPE